MIIYRKNVKQQLHILYIKFRLLVLKDYTRSGQKILYHADCLLIQQDFQEGESKQQYKYFNKVNG